MFSKAKSLPAWVRWLALTPALVFMISTMVVNGGNYLYNVMLGRVLHPALFSEAGFLITLLLVFAFLAMTFQIVCAKFSIEWEGPVSEAFKRWINQVGLSTGILVAGLMWILSPSLTQFFQLANPWTIPIFSCALPLFFVMSNYRGFLQGKEQFMSLSASYQLEMWVRFALTFTLILSFSYHPTNMVALAVVASIVAGFLVMRPDGAAISWKASGFDRSGEVIRFFMLTAGYECAQILINYSDILLVKHYFDGEVAGKYTSIALIGRMIYFMTWMLVMILIPKVLNLRKKGQPYKRTLLRYFAAIATFSCGLIIGALLFPKTIILLLFGEAYLSVSHLLWQYATATMLFALSNLFVYYFLSLDNRKPVYLAIGSGVVQVVSLLCFHQSLEQMIIVQMINMGVLLLVMILAFTRSE